MEIISCGGRQATWSLREELERMKALEKEPQGGREIAWSHRPPTQVLSLTISFHF